MKIQATQKSLFNLNPLDMHTRPFDRKNATV